MQIIFTLSLAVILVVLIEIALHFFGKRILSRKQKNEEKNRCWAVLSNFQQQLTVKIARKLAKQNFNLVLAGKQIQKLNELAQNIKLENSQMEVVTVNKDMKIEDKLLQKIKNETSQTIFINVIVPFNENKLIDLKQLKNNPENIEISSQIRQNIQEELKKNIFQQMKQQIDKLKIMLEQKQAKKPIIIEKIVEKQIQKIIKIIQKQQIIVQKQTIKLIEIPVEKNQIIQIQKVIYKTNEILVKDDTQLEQIRILKQKIQSLQDQNKKLCQDLSFTKNKSSQINQIEKRYAQESLTPYFIQQNPFKIAQLNYSLIFIQKEFLKKQIIVNRIPQKQQMTNNNNDQNKSLQKFQPFFINKNEVVPSDLYFVSELRNKPKKESQNGYIPNF